MSPFVRNPLLSHFAHRVGLVTLRQTFVRRRHGGGNRACWRLNDEQSELLSPEPRKGLGFNPDGARRAFPPGDRAPQRRWRAGGAASQARRPNAEAIADPQARLNVQSQIRLLDEAAIALKDDCLGFTLARDFDPREIGLLYYVMASSRTLGEALQRLARYSKVTNEALVFGYREGNRLVINLSYFGVPRHSDRTSD